MGLERAFERAKAADRAEDNARVRIFLLLLLFGAGFTRVAVGAVQSALFSGFKHPSPYVAPAGPSRADLVDRQGQLLAIDLPHYGVYLNGLEVFDPAESQRVLRARFPTLSPQRLDKALHSERPEYLTGGLTPEEKTQLQDRGLPGVSFAEEPKRIYPRATTAAHVIGFATAQGVGMAGAEKAFDADIRRQAGGQPFPLSLDLRVQAALDDELQKAALKFGVTEATGLVTNIHTGEVLAMSSWPVFDPNRHAEADQHARGEQSDLTNRATSGLYEPGSVFKVFTLAAALDSGNERMDSVIDATPVHIGKRVIGDFEKHAAYLSLPQVFTLSSNDGAARIAMKMGAPTMTQYFTAFGLFNPARTELPEFARPTVPRTWPDTTLASVSFGQSISVTPLALAQGMGAILNGGERLPLTLRIQPPGARPAGTRVVSQDTARKMLALMRLNVTGGSGSKADVPGLSVGGKTGTAQLVIDHRYSKDRVLATFAAVFPTDGPLEADRYFVLIMLKDPKRLPETKNYATAGWNAAPTAGKVIERIAPFLGVQRALVASAPEAKVELAGGEGLPAADESLR
jgi:cell division protein FtsI (penicillin-binding protein 3)